MVIFPTFSNNDCPERYLAHSVPQSVDKMIHRMINYLFMAVAGENRVSEFSELNQAVQGTQEGDGIPARVAALKQPGPCAAVNRFADQPDNPAAVTINFVF
jgi:hypothetical protein